MTAHSGKQIAGIAALVAAGLATGVAIEQRVVGNRYRYDPDQDEPFGQLHGDKVEVIASDGVELNVEVDDYASQAFDDNLTIIFSHGYALNQNCWHYQRRDLRFLGRLVFWDQRSHGMSLRGDPELSTIDQLGLDLGSVIDAVGRDGPIVLVGHSMGGMTIMALAAQRPELFEDGPVKGVALLATSAGGMSAEGFGLPPAVGSFLHKAAPAVISRALRRKDLIEAGRAAGSDLGLLLIKHYSFGSDVSSSMTSFTSEMIRGTPFDVIAEFLPGIDAHEKSEALATLSGVESLVMVGTKDRLTPIKHASEIIRRMPHAKSVLLPETGHMLMMERYPEVNSHLRQLVSRVRNNAERSEADTAESASA